MAENVINKLIEDEMKISYINYAMSVIVSRALPDVRDGLKPVHRRILYSMHKQGNVYNKAHRKCAKTVGDVLGNYHPHGDQSVYDALVRMAQPFSLRYMLVDGQGNFGSIDGDGAAAMRYTEARMARLADEMLKDIQKDTIDFQNNYDETTKEPTVLPAMVPNLLINGSTGIAVGMATNLPPHNLREVVSGVIHYIDNNDCTIDDLMTFIKAPDFPLGGIIYNTDGIKKAYHTGKGIFKVRGRVSIEEVRKGREAIIITEIPYMVNKAEMIKKIAVLVKNETIKGISDFRDESDKDGIRVVIELKKDSNTQITLNQLYKHTPLEDSFGINSIALVDKSPKVLNLKELIQHFVNHRFEVITRRIKFDLKKAKERAHIVEGLIKAVENIDEIIKLIKASPTVDEARKQLMSRYAFSEIQAQAILDMRLARLVALEIKKLKEEYAELQKLIAELEDLLANPSKIYNIIKEQLTDISDRYGDDRRTEITHSNINELDAEDYIHKTNAVISLTKSGYIKRIPTQTYKQQRRGGVGIRGVSNSNEEDIISKLFTATTHDIIMFFSNKGKAYYLKTHEISQASRTAKGNHIKMLLNLSGEEEIQGYLVFESFEDAGSVMMITAHGTTKKTRIKELINAKKRGIQAIKLRENDTLVGTIQINKGEDVIFTTRKGLALRTNESNIREMGRTAGGVRGINISSGDAVVGLLKVEDSYNMLVISENGFGKKLAFSEFSAKGRGGKGQIYMKTNEKSGEIASLNTVHDDDHVLIISSAGNVIRLDVKNISLLGRPAKGPKLANVKSPDFVVDAAVIRPLDLDN